jgi:rfaE bifunctional protein kinase chain/domain
MKKIIDKFSDINALLIGDFILDKFIYGKTSRISREAPVLVLKYTQEKFVPGGGGNAASNLISLGANVKLLTVIGNDNNGKILLNHFKDRQVDISDIIIDENRVTASKTRIMAGGHHTTSQQVIRVDKENEEEPDESIKEKLLDKIEKSISQVDLIVLSDYGLGIFTDKIIKKVSELAYKYKDKIFLVDSRYQLMKFKNMTVATPNEEEAAGCIGASVDKLNLKKAGYQILKETDNKFLIITRGSEGMAIFQAEREEIYLPIYGSSKITDVTGAGDTVSATVGMSLAAGANIEEAARIATLAASVVVHLPGTVPVDYKQLYQLVERVEKSGFYK